MKGWASSTPCNAPRCPRPTLRLLKPFLVVKAKLVLQRVGAEAAHTGGLQRGMRGDERAGEIDRAAALLDHGGAESGCGRVERGIEHAEIGGEPDQVQTRDIALAQISRQPRRSMAVIL